jgi:NADH:ubiquinone oxidoreductase subunit B-like Fe-S oxidoreductase
MIPTDGVPALLKQAEPLHAAVKVDLHIPGCPPRPEAILDGVVKLLAKIEKGGE